MPLDVPHWLSGDSLHCVCAFQEEVLPSARGISGESWKVGYKTLLKSIMQIIDKELISELYNQALVNPRLRQSFDLRSSADDSNQRMLNALMPGTQVPIHRHPNSNENVILISGKVEWVLYEEEGPSNVFPQGMDAQDVTSGKRLKETVRYLLDPSIGNFGCVVPKGAWHTVETLEPSVIFEVKDGRYGDDGSEVW